MSKILNTAAAILMLGLAATGAAHAAYGHLAVHPGYAGRLPAYVPQQPVTPQFNNPSPQISVPQTGNAVDQRSRSVALIVYVAWLVGAAL